MMTNVLIKISPQEALEFAENAVSDLANWYNFAVRMDDQGWFFRKWYGESDQRRADERDYVTITDYDAGEGVRKTVEVVCHGQHFKFGHDEAVHLERLYEEVCQKP